MDWRRDGRIVGPEHFVLGLEESHGYLVGQYARDKDGAVAAMLFAELAADAKAQGQSLHERLEALYWQHGYHAERLVTQKMAGFGRDGSHGSADEPPFVQILPNNWRAWMSWPASATTSKVR